MVTVPNVPALPFPSTDDVWGEQLNEAIVARSTPEYHEALLPAAVATTASPSRFPGMDPTGAASSSAAFQSAIEQAPNGGTLILPDGNYKFEGAPLVVRNADGSEKSLTINLGSARILVNADAYFIRAAGSFGTVHPVSSYTVGTVAHTNGSQLNTVVLTVSTDTGYKRGDLVKLVSDDVIPGARPGSNGVESRVGQKAVVWESTPTTVTLLGVLRDPMTTGIRVAKYSTASVAVVGGIIDYPDTAVGATPWSYGPFLFSSLGYAEIRGTRIKRSPNAAIGIASCAASLVDRVRIDYALDSPSQDRYGYGVIASATEGFKMTNCDMSLVRHGYTDDTPRVAANSGIANYGRTFGSIIDTCTVSSATSSAFDTHLTSDSTSFVNCKAVNSPAGFGLRGRGHSVTGCTGVDNYNEVNMFDEVVGGWSFNHTIDGYSSTRCQSTVIRHSKQGTLETASSTIRGVQAVDARGPLVSSILGTLTVSDSKAVFATTLADGSAGIRADGAVIEFKDVTLDYRMNTAGATLVPVSAAVSGGTISGVGLDILNTSGSTGRFYRMLAVTTPASTTIRCADVFISYSGVNVNDEYATGWFDFTTLDGKLNSSITNLVDAAIAGVIANNKPSPARSRKQVFHLECVPTGTDRTLGNLAAGSAYGQELLVSNRGTAGNVTLATTDTLLSLGGGTNKVLAPGQVIRLQWVNFSGGRWRHESFV